MDAATLAGMVQENKLGLSEEESARALGQLSRFVKVDLNRVSSARELASKELRRVSIDSLENPFDGSAPLSGGDFEVAAPKASKAVEIDRRTGKQKLQVRRRTSKITVDGACGAIAEQAISEFRSLVRGRMDSGGTDAGFFRMAGMLFYPPEEAEGFPMPRLTSGVTEMPTAIATYHPGQPGLLTFDCEKFDALELALRRKIACHEFYHWYQDRIGALEEPSAYAIMPHC